MVVFTWACMKAFGRLIPSLHLFIFPCRLNCTYSKATVVSAEDFPQLTHDFHLRFVMPVNQPAHDSDIIILLKMLH